jgi:hypothetical protein
MMGWTGEEEIILYLRKAFCGIASKNKFELHELVYNVYHRGVCPEVFSHYIATMRLNLSVSKESKSMERPCVF